VFIVCAAIVMVVGCASKTSVPHIWDLARAAARADTTRAGLTVDEKARLAKQPLGRDRYQLIGVADFVDPETSRAIGDRAQILAAPRVNATGMLVTGHKVAVKGILIDAAPPRINLTSVADLGVCPGQP
jgi:hypothetical protein